MMDPKRLAMMQQMARSMPNLANNIAMRTGGQRMPGMPMATNQMQVAPARRYADGGGIAPLTTAYNPAGVQNTPTYTGDTGKNPVNPATTSYDPTSLVGMPPQFSPEQQAQIQQLQKTQADQMASAANMAKNYATLGGVPQYSTIGNTPSQLSADEQAKQLQMLNSANQYSAAGGGTIPLYGGAVNVSPEQLQQMQDAQYKQYLQREADAQAQYAKSQQASAYDKFAAEVMQAAGQKDAANIAQTSTAYGAAPGVMNTAGIDAAKMASPYGEDRDDDRDGGYGTYQPPAERRFTSPYSVMQQAKRPVASTQAPMPAPTPAPAPAMAAPTANPYASPSTKFAGIRDLLSRPASLPPPRSVLPARPAGGIGGLPFGSNMPRFRR